MGKIVKYCSSCDEGFAERFGFCPDCGAPLQAFEMNPVGGGEPVPVESNPVIETAPVEQPVDVTPIPVQPEIPVTSFAETPAEEVDATPIEVEAPAAFAEPEASFDDQGYDDEVVDDAVVDTHYDDAPAAGVTYVAGAGLTGLVNEAYQESRREGHVFTPSAPARPAFVGGSNFLGLSDETARAGSNYHYQAKYADVPNSAFEKANTWDYSHPDDGGFYVTVVQDKNHAQRNKILLGSTVLVLFTAVMAWGVSLFQKSLDVGAIGSETSLAYLLDEVPMPIEDEPQKAEKEKGGGGGGGGREEKEETSQGDLADQSRTPTHIKPDVNIVKNDNFELKQPQATTEGDRKFPKEFDRYGDPNSKFAGLSNGTGSGGGQGSGYGNGQGSGFGTGAGSGSGSGSGGGNGDGNGDGSGPGGSGGPPPTAVAKVTSPLKIISKPQAKYTDEGRTNNIQGSVRLKVTLLANGSVGSITPVTRLPHGLTEQAIAAARLLRFEPAKVNGVAVAKTITIDYSFTIY